MLTAIKKTIKPVLVLTGLTTFLWSFISGLLMGLFGFASASSSTQSNAVQAVAAVLGMCLFNSILVIWYTQRSRYSDRRLFGAVFTFIFGVMSFMTQIETVYFNKAINMPGIVISIVIFTGAVVGLTNGWFALRLRRKSIIVNQIYFDKGIHLSFKRLLVLSLIYMFFYFLFGYYIAWQFPELRQFYTGSVELLPFITHMKNQIVSDPYLIVFQILRGSLWSMIGYIALKGLQRHNKLETCILIGLILSLPLSTPLFSPNDYMPPGVRLGHFFELLIENFLFGIILSCIFQKKAKVGW
jgi:hypothetical protein